MVYFILQRQKRRVRQDNDKNMATEYINAKQVYERYRIARSMLGRLVESGRVTRKSIDDGVMVLNLYKVADIEAVVEGASSNG